MRPRLSPNSEAENVNVPGRLLRANRAPGTMSFAGEVAGQLGNGRENDDTAPDTKFPRELAMLAITLDEAVKIINATFAEAKRRNAYPLTAVLLDAGGRMKAALKQDGASLLRFEVSYGKAYAALAMGRESRQVLQKAKEKPLFMQSFLELADGPMFLEGGGQLIRDNDGEVIGAIATTGDTNEVDDLCAIAGIRAAGFKTDQDFSDADMRRLNIKRGPPIEDPEKSKAHLKSV